MTLSEIIAHSKNYNVKPLVDAGFNIFIHHSDKGIDLHGKLLLIEESDKPAFYKTENGSLKHRYNDITITVS